MNLCLFMGLLSCCCVAASEVHARLPATVTMNKDAGRGGLLIVEVRLADGEKLPLVVDTGAAWTILDKSLEPKLGKPLDTTTLLNFGVKQDSSIYVAPKLYLGNVLLQMTGTNIATFDRKKMADDDWPGFMGFLGMDVLEHYCIQLDFATGQMRFLDDTRADKSHWGKPFPLKDIGDGCVTIDENLTGVKGMGSLLDTGCDSSGWLQPALYRQWTNQQSSADEKVYSPDGALGGEIYHELDFRLLDAKSLEGDDQHIKINGVGLRVLAQNLVTLDFPNRMMYLKHVNDWPLVSRDVEAAMKAAEKSSMKLFQQLFKKRQLPGISKNAEGRTTGFHFDQDRSPYLDTGTWDVVKSGDSSVYHYAFTRTSKNGLWKLQKAWRTDQNGKTVEAWKVEDSATDGHR